MLYILCYTFYVIYKKNCTTQGEDDKVVLPNQAEMMVEVLKNRGLPVAYVLFEGVE
jgi:hypothetical protein